MPCSCACRAADSAESWAAKGVDLREPLKPTVPDDAQLMTAPVGSVIVTLVLLNVDLMWAWPTATFFFSLRRGLRAAAFGAAITCALPSSCLQRCASVPCGYERWSWCAVREPADRDGGECPGSCRSRPCGECRRRPRGGGHPPP